MYYVLCIRICFVLSILTCAYTHAQATARSGAKNMCLVSYLISWELTSSYVHVQVYTLSPEHVLIQWHLSFEVPYFIQKFSTKIWENPPYGRFLGQKLSMFRFCHIHVKEPFCMDYSSLVPRPLPVFNVARKN